MNASPPPRRCWACDAEHLVPVEGPAVGRDAIDPASFRPTDAGYGRTLPLVRCGDCAFVQLADPFDPTPFYARMEDPDLDALRPFRARQARDLLAPPPVGAGPARLLDVGAGSGALVEEALRLGWAAEGVEPSEALAAAGRDRGLPIHAGTLPHAGLHPPYDRVTLVDVLEHVTDPRALVAGIRRVLRPGGHLLVVTPDQGSLAARLLGRRWWHRRVAHVGYFSPGNLDRLLAREGFVLAHRERPSWYFPVGYLRDRAATFLPFLTRLPVPSPIARLTVRLNLLDSIAATYRAPAP